MEETVVWLIEGDDELWGGGRVGVLLEMEPGILIPDELGVIKGFSPTFGFGLLST